MMKIIGIVLLLTVVAALLFILFTPLRITINTVAQDFNIRMKGIFKLEILLDEEKLFNTRFIIFRKEVDLEPLKNKAQTRGIKFIKQSKGKSSSALKKLPRLVKLLRAFTVRKLFVEIDSGNVMLNAWLHPVFYHVSADNKYLHVNYLGREQLIFEAQTRTIILLYCFFK